MLFRSDVLCSGDLNRYKYEVLKLRSQLDLLKKEVNDCKLKMKKCQSFLSDDKSIMKFKRGCKQEETKRETRQLSDIDNKIEACLTNRNAAIYDMSKCISKLSNYTGVKFDVGNVKFLNISLLVSEYYSFKEKCKESRIIW